MKTMLQFKPLHSLFFICFLALSFSVVAQNGGVAVGHTAPDPSAALDVQSEERGLLMPRMSTGDRNAITNPATGLLVFDMDKQCLYMFDGQSWKPIGYLTSDDEIPLLTRGADPDLAEFGWKVAVHGDFAVIGAPSSFGVFPDGAAFVFSRNGGSWTQEQQLIPTSPFSPGSAKYGYSVDIQENRVVIGAPGDESIYIFERNDTTWVEVEKVQPNSPPIDLDFGFSVALDSNTIAIGAPKDEVFGNAGEGSIYIYDFDGLYWTQTTRVVQAGGTGYGPGDGFGWDVDLKLPHLIGGAPKQGLNNEGSAQIFKQNAGGFYGFLEEKNSTLANSWKGYAVAISDEIAVVGSPGATTYRGSVTAYNFNASSGLYNGSSSSVSGGSLPVYSYLGGDVAASGDVWVVSAPNESLLSSNVNYGEQRVEVRGLSGIKRILHTDSSYGFGTTVAMDGYDVLIGNPSSRNFYVKNLE